MRDRDVMNLLDQLELFTLKLGSSQQDYWTFVYETMKSGELLTRQMEQHLQYKLENLPART